MIIDVYTHMISKRVGAILNKGRYYGDGKEFPYPAKNDEAEERLNDRLFRTSQPGAETGEFLDDLNADSVRVIRAQLEPALKDAAAEDRFQFERHGYFVADRIDSQPGAPVFNRTVTLKDSWVKAGN
jgi:glutaminyl-tRNA synthetase